MVSKEELYVLIDERSYKRNKSNILNSQADLLKIKKHIQNLRIISGQKKELQIKLIKTFESINNHIEAIQKKIPKPNIPKEIRKEEEVAESVEEISVEREGIEDELEKIQKKLRELNS
jgi:seryl-tRNA synthetase|tara:strand:+ start:240 stop:593 length:354 start_codon:yes stop_codon:yes gene_type:complete